MSLFASHHNVKRSGLHRVWIAISLLHGWLRKKLRHHVWLICTPSILTYFHKIIPTIPTLSPFNSFPTTGLACRSTRRSSLLLNLICRPLRYTTVRWYTLTSKGHKQIYFPICMIYFNHIGSYITHTRHPRCGVDAGMHIEWKPPGTCGRSTFKIGTTVLIHVI